MIYNLFKKINLFYKPIKYAVSVNNISFTKSFVTLFSSILITFVQQQKHIKNKLDEKFKKNNFSVIIIDLYRLHK